MPLIVYSCFWLSPTKLWAFNELWPIPVCWYRTDLVMTTKCHLKLETWVYPVSLTCASFPWHKIWISTMAHSYHLLGSCFNGIQRNWVNSVISNEIRSMFLDFWNNLSIESKKRWLSLNPASLLCDTHVFLEFRLSWKFMWLCYVWLPITLKVMWFHGMLESMDSPFRIQLW